MLVRPTRSFPGTALLLRGTAISQIWPWLLGIGGIASGVTYLNEVIGMPEAASVTLIPFSLMGLALSIFLGFRNNACYDRWWEARKLWGALINQSRIQARDSLQFMDLDEAQGQALVRRIAGFPYALKAHLRTEASFEALADFVPRDEVDALKPEPNVPDAYLMHLGEAYTREFKAGRLGEYRYIALMKGVARLSDIQGGCERIKNTPVPISYTVLTHRIVALYCLSLPFGLVGEIHWLTPVVVLIVSFAFLGLDAVGTQIEDPFETDPNDLPLAALARTIERDLKARIGDPIPDKVAPVGGILL
ncbi:MAG: bestrophin [Deltaproteobacteria bacterium]|nr:MAG: bestrophin [Deltaproteobacteria bacterium]